LGVFKKGIFFLKKKKFVERGGFLIRAFPDFKFFLNWETPKKKKKKKNLFFSEGGGGGPCGKRGLELIEFFGGFFSPSRKKI